MSREKDDGTQGEARLKAGELTERKEYGGGLIRMPEGVLKKMGVNEGDIVKITGRQRSAAIALCSHKDEEKAGIAQMDGLTRRNCGISIGDEAVIGKADAKGAKRITIAPSRKGIIMRMSPELMKRNILMRPFVKGDVFVQNPAVKSRKESTMFGEYVGKDFEDFLFAPFGEEKFVVRETVPEGIVKVTENTELQLLPSAAAVPEADIPSENIVEVAVLPDMKRFIRVKSAEDIARIAKMGYPVGRHQTRMETTLISGIYYWKGKKGKDKREKNQDERGKNEMADDETV